MSKKVFNVFSILCFALVLCFIGCTELINPKTETDINLNIDLSKIIKSTRNTGETQSSASLGENPTIKVAIYDAKKYNATTNSTENLTLITQAQASIGGDGIARVKLSDIPVGIDAIVFAELSFSNGNSTEVMYAGNSEVFKVKASNNKISLVLKTVGVDIEPDDEINAETPTIITQPESSIKTVTDDNNNKQTLSCTAHVSDGGTLSFVWYVKNDIDEYCRSTNLTKITNNDDGSITSELINLEAQRGQIFYVYCEITNTNNSVNGEKTASIYSNEVTVAYVEGSLTSITAKYTGSYELLGKDFTYSNVSVTETYTSSDNATNPTPITVIADKNRYTISPNLDSKDAIGYVPYTVTYNDSTLPSSPTASLIVPVKYELDASYLVLETCFNSSSVSVSDIENKINIPQYGTVKYDYQISDNDISSFIDKNGNNTEIEDINNTDYYTATIVDEKNQNIDSIASVGVYTYTVTLKSANEWFICNSNTSKYFSVEVCPWKINLTPSESTSTVDTNNISPGTYTLSISNDAYTTSQNLPSATFSCLENNNIITNNELTIDNNFTNGTIKASIGNIEVALLEISRVNTSVTYAEGLTCEVDSVDTVTLHISNADGLAIFRNIVNGSFTEKIIVQYESNPDRNHTFSANNANQNVNAVLESDITLFGDWTPIGVYPTNTTPTAKPYSGTFDGNGKTITFDNITHNDTNMYSSGLFQMLAGTVKNLIIDGSISRNVAGYIGGITGYLNGGTIENCVNKAIITNSASNVTGGIVGYVANSTATIKNCVNIGNVKSLESTVGGIVGTTDVMTETKVSISKCINMGEISALSIVAGILGLAYPITIENCINLGKVISTGEDSCYAAGIVIPSDEDVSVTVTNSINVGQVSATGETSSNSGAISSIPTSGTYTNNYYDSTVNLNVLDSDIDGITDQLTSELIGSNLQLNGITEDNWCFADGRYPLPNIAGSIPGGENGEIWNDVIEAATPESTSTSGGGIDSRYVSSAEELNGALEDTSVNTILINADISIDSTINITRDVTIAANNDFTITQNVSSSEMINVAENVNFVLGGGSGTLTIMGNSSLTQNIIYSKGNVTLKDKLVINNSYATSGAIYVYAGSLKMEGGEISNNQSNAITSNMGGGDVTIDIYGGKIYNNTKDSQYYGSAIYINNSSYYDATVNIYGEAQIYNNNNSSGAAIRLYDADSVLYINSSDSENKAAIYDNTIKNIQIDAGQLFIENTEIDLSNYTDSNIQ